MKGYVEVNERESDREVGRRDVGERMIAVTQH